MNGAGAAGLAICKLLLSYGAEHIVMCDSKGAIYKGRDNLNPYKEGIAELTNRDMKKGSLAEVIVGSDAFIGVSVKDCLSQEMVKTMNEKPIIFAMANPDPEILPDLAREAGALVVATGRSDFPNQVNNVLAFPPIFRGALDVRATRITEAMKVAAAEALANHIEDPNSENIIPSPLDRTTAPKVAQAVAEAWKNGER